MHSTYKMLKKFKKTQKYKRNICVFKKYQNHINLRISTTTLTIGWNGTQLEKQNYKNSTHSCMGLNIGLTDWYIAFNGLTWHTESWELRPNDSIFLKYEFITKHKIHDNTTYWRLESELRFLFFCLFLLKFLLQSRRRQNIFRKKDPSGVIWAACSHTLVMSVSRVRHIITWFSRVLFL